MGIFNKRKQKITFEDTIYFEFSYHVGNYDNGRVIYKIKLEDDKYIASLKDNMIPEENRLIKKISKEEIKLLEEILKNYKVDSWDGFNKFDPEVLDGDDFTLSYKENNKPSISARGYEMYPNNYKELKEEIDKLFKDLFKNKNEG